MSTPDKGEDSADRLRLLFVGDVFGRPGRKALSRGIGRLSERFALDGIVVNGENLAGGKGLNQKTVAECFGMGVTAITTGNHLFDQKDTFSLLQKENRILRPLKLCGRMPWGGCVCLRSSQWPDSGHGQFDWPGIHVSFRLSFPCGGQNTGILEQVRKQSGYHRGRFSRRGQRRKACDGFSPGRTGPSGVWDTYPCSDE